MTSIINCWKKVDVIENIKNNVFNNMVVTNEIDREKDLLKKTINFIKFCSIFLKLKITYIDNNKKIFLIFIENKCVNIFSADFF